MNPKVGDIGLVRGTGFMAWLIRLVTRSPYAHAIVYVGKGRIVEAEPSGAVLRELHYGKVFWCTNIGNLLTPNQRLGVAAWAISRTETNGGKGTPYSWLDDLEIGLVDLFGWAPEPLRENLRSDKTLMCSQLAVAAYRANKEELFPGKPDGAEAPATIWRLEEKLAA